MLISIIYYDSDLFNCICVNETLYIVTVMTNELVNNKVGRYGFQWFR
jgi:hypothetical protein